VKPRFLPPAVTAFFMASSIVVVEGIILAAGLSTRMGRPKPLISIDGQPVIALVVQAATASTLHRVMLVTGALHEQIIRSLGSLRANRRLFSVRNLHPELGMASSLRAGMAELSAEASGVMVMLGDQPRLTAAVVDRILMVFRADPTKIVLPTVKGRRTTPVVFPHDLFEELRGVTGDVGGRDVVNRNQDRVVPLEMDESYDDADLDTPEDLDKMMRRE